MRCACGCGEEAKNRYVHGHNQRGNFRWRYVEEDRGHETPCWIWQGALNNMGYGTIGGSHSKRRGLAHRIFYEDMVGPIPDGLTLDHLCRTPRCINPQHLEPVTHADNCSRSIGAGRPRRHGDYEHFSLFTMSQSTSLIRRDMAEIIGCSPSYVTRVLGRSS